MNFKYDDTLQISLRQHGKKIAWCDTRNRTQFFVTWRAHLKFFWYATWISSIKKLSNDYEYENFIALQLSAAVALKINHKNCFMINRTFFSQFIKFENTKKTKTNLHPRIRKKIFPQFDSNRVSHSIMLSKGQCFSCLYSSLWSFK